MTPIPTEQAIYDLRKSGRRKEALDAARAALAHDPSHAGIRRAAGWCLYDAVKERLADKPTEQSVAIVNRHLRQLAEWSHDAIAALSTYDRYDPFPLTLTLSMKWAKKAERPRQVIEWGRLARPELLSPLPSGDYRSSRYEWLNAMTWALEETEQWEELVDVERLALTVIDSRQFTCWFSYRYSKAHLQLGRPEVAEALLMGAFPVRREPWQRVAMARILVALHRESEAVQEARQALASTADDDLLFTIDALHLIAQCLADVEPQRASAHAAIAIRTRLANGYGPDSKVTETLSLLELKEIQPASDAELVEQRAWWKETSTPAIEGTVEKHLSHGGAGFITGDDGESYYFSRRRDDDRPLFPLGTRVRFVPEASFDAKKQKASLKATKVRRL